MSSDHELMRNIGEGDAAAFEQLVRRWEGRVNRVFRRLTPTGSDIDSLTQDAFVRVLLASRRYQPRCEFATWLFRIVLNLARDSRRSQRHAMTSLDGDSHRGNGEAPDAQSERNERCRLVESAMAILSERHREVLVLRHFAGLTFTRVAEVLRQPESTIKSRAQTALIQLEAELRRKGLTNGEFES